MDENAVHPDHRALMGEASREFDKARRPVVWRGAHGKTRRILVGVLALASFAFGCSRPPPAPTSAQEARWLSYFPSGYEESRARFRKNCALHVVSPEDFCRSAPVASPTDPSLTIDYGFFGRGGDRLIIIQSGIHGSEAAPGAAVQEFVLQEYLSRLLDQHIDVFVIHALNPYGFKYVRRTDEFNVNLNRNFVADGSDYKKQNPDYERMRGLFEPVGPVQNVWLSALGNHGRFIGRVIGDGFNARPLTIGLDSGQYRHREGMNYGGQTPAQQVSFLRTALGPIMERPYRKILFLDFHTGLGRNGELAVIEGIHPAGKLLGEFKQLMSRHEHDGIVIHSGNDAGFFPTSGDVIDFVPGLVHPSDPRVLALTMEYGSMGIDTISQLRSASRMILENRAHFYPCTKSDNAPCAEIRQDFRALFSPTDTTWRLKVMREADLIFSRLLDWEH
ncbi:MAG TPA: M14 family metallopeptidase [Rhizomicrobium sp.]|jgi:hypothetical protein